MMQKILERLALGLTLCVLVGCGSDQLPTHPVAGKIVFDDGKSPTFGAVEFYNDEHKLNARGKIKSDGTFTVTTYTEDDGAVLGRHKIVIAQIVSGPIGPLAGGASTIVHNHGAVVAKKYLDYRTSGLSWDIKEGLNSIELKVEKGDED